MNKQLDEILDFCFDGEVSWTRDQLEDTSYYKESMENIDKRKAEAKVKLQKLIIEAKIEQSYRCRDLIEASADREEDEELLEKLVETILSILGIIDRSSGNRPGQIATLEQVIVSYITADRKRIKELGLEQAQEIYNSVQKEKVEKLKAVSENEKIREMLNDPEVIGKAAKGAIKAQRKMAGLESEEK